MWPPPWPRPSCSPGTFRDPPVKGKWAAGIAPRNFAWIIKDQLAVSERPGGYARSHRPVRRQEEIIWIREQKFTRVVSLLVSPHNLHAYAELGVKAEHLPMSGDDQSLFLADLYRRLRLWIGRGDKVLVHHEEMGDHLQGVVAGYLVHSGLVPEPAQAIVVVETINHRQMGGLARELVALASELGDSAR